MFSLFLLLVVGCVGHVQRHGTHEQQPIAPDADWATIHMAEEHHINNFDAGSFFALHDYDSSGEWTADDLLKTFGLKDESTNHIPGAEKDLFVKGVIDMYDRDGSRSITLAEYLQGLALNKKLPSPPGGGPGHHGDDEYEYEIHHWEKYHDENTKFEDLTHPEDIEHFRKHELLEEQAEMQEKMDRLSIIEANIPPKFRRGG